MNKFLFLDFETSGLSNQYDQILQVGAAVMDLDGNIEATFTARIRPSAKFKISLEALAVQVDTLTPDTLREWYADLTSEGIKESREVFGEFRAWVGPYRELPVVAWNASFDRAFWAQWRFNNSAQAKGSSILSPTWICAMEYAMNCPELGVPKFSLDIVCRAMGLERPKAHDALADAIIAGMVYGRLTRGIYAPLEEVTA